MLGWYRLLNAARGALRLLDSYGPDEHQEDQEFVSTRAALRRALSACGRRFSTRGGRRA